MLHRLMRWTVFSIAYCIVRKHKKCRQLHQRSKPDCRSRVVAEDEERCAEGPHLGQRQSIHNRGHRVFTNSEMQILPREVLSLEISRARKGQGGLVRWSKVSRAAEEPRDVLCEHIQYLAGCFPPCDSFRIYRKHGQIFIPSARKLSA